MNKVYTFLISILLVNTAFSQVVIEWQKTIGGSSSDNLLSIEQTSDGGYILGGWSHSDISGDKTENSNGFADYWIVKTDDLGNIQWQNTIGGDGWDYLYSLKQTSDGGFILGGYSNSNLSGDKTELNNGGDDYWIIKTDVFGNIQWQNTIGGSGDDHLRSIQQTNDGGYIIGGYSNSPISGDKTENGNGIDDYWIIKTDFLGNIMWQNTIGGSGQDFLYSIQQTADGGFILGGSSSSNISGDKTENSNGINDYWIVKTDSSGIIQWQNTIGGDSLDDLYTIKQTFDGGYILGGWSNSSISGDKIENTNGGSDYWIIKTDALGNIEWQNTIGGNGGENLYFIQQTTDGGYILGGRSDSDNSGDKTENSKGGYDYWVVKTDSIGNIQWQNTIGGSGYDWLTSLQQTSDGDYILGGWSDSDISGDKTENSKGMNDYWIVKTRKNFNRITGKIFFDLNTNSLHDISEPSLDNHMVHELNTSRISFSQNYGYYYLDVFDSGSYVNYPSTLLNFASLPLQHNLYFSGINQTDSLKDFAFQPLGVFNDLQITISPVGPFRPGFNAHYNIHYKNVGTTIQQGAIVFFPDSVLTYISSSVTPLSVTNDSITWQTPFLNPFDEGDIFVTLNVDPSTPIGYWVDSWVKIEPVNGDANPSDNVSSWRIQTTGSFDPNDILVNRDSILTTELANPPYLEYLIRFQNTGNDTAFTVKIKNELPSNLQLTTFEFVNSSHPVQLNYSNEEEVMWFKFENILLPDSNTNELLSHGFVRYRIKPFDTLSVGDLIENTAAIYFDFNAPVITNIAVTEIVLPSFVPSIKEDFNFSLYPNPTTGEINISFSLKESSHVKIELFNSLGQIVNTIEDKKLNAGENKINFSTQGISKGIYHLKFSVDGNAVAKKVIKM